MPRAWKDHARIERAARAYIAGEVEFRGAVERAACSSGWFGRVVARLRETRDNQPQNVGE